ncbi:hypothetical protein ACVR05_08080 [Streptococcus caprae]|uniref:Cingulin n=1 Tax=Streptococcus caprae TaxID=1640501 RepID=A0ABV8CT55_9STRE
MDELERLEDTIFQQRLELEWLEDDFNREKRQYEDDCNQLDGRQRDLSFLVDEFSELVFYQQRQNPSSEVRAFTNLLTDYNQVTEISFKEELDRLDAAFEEKEANFRKKYRQLDQAIEDNDQLKRQLYNKK